MTEPPDDRPTGEERPAVCVPRYASGDEVVDWSAVDAEWWEHVQRARRVHEQVVEEYAGAPGVVYVEQSRGDSEIAGHATTVVTILVEEGAPDLDVPDEIDGIPIRVAVGGITDATDRAASCGRGGLPWTVLRFVAGGSPSGHDRQLEPLASPAAVSVPVARSPRVPGRTLIPPPGNTPAWPSGSAT